MKGKTALFLAFVSLLFGCPPGGESGTVTLGDVSVTPVRGYNTTATFELKAAVQTNVEATLTIVVKDETGAEAANSGAMKVKAGNSTQTFSTKIEKFGNMKATFTLAAAGVETQTKSVDFEVLEGGVPSAEFGWPATGVYAGAKITISMKDVKADTAGTGEGTFKLSQAAFTMKKGGSPFEFAFPPLLNDDATLNQNVQITLPSEHGNYSITLSVTNTNNQTREKTVEFALADKVNVASINAEPSTFSDLIVNDTVKVTLTFTGEGEQTPSDINVNWDEGSNYSVELVEQTATTAVYNLTVLSSSLSTAKATAADGSGKSVTISFAGIEGNKVPGTKTVNNREVELKWVENFNKIDDAFFKKWRADGYRSETDKLKRFYWRPEALEMTELDGRQVFTMFTREWGSRDTDPETYPGKGIESLPNNVAGENWIAGGIHLQDNIVFGYMEARVRTARNSNQQWDAFWSYDTSGGTSPIEYEFDIMEAKSVTALDVTTHFWKGGRFWTSPSIEHDDVNGSVNLNNDWYTLGLYWTPEEVIYYGYHGDTPIALAGIKSDYTLTHGYQRLNPNSRTPKKEHPFISRWEQGFKFTTELGQAYGGSGRPSTEEKYYIDYFAYYHIPVSQAELAENIQNGTAAFDRTKPGDANSAWADIASAGNPIYVTVTPAANYTTESVKATWGVNESKDLVPVEGEPNRWKLIVDANMPQYYDFDAQDYGDPVTITPTFVQSNAALETVELNCDEPRGIEGKTITVNYTPNPSNAVINSVSVSAGYEYDKETKELTLRAIDEPKALVKETVTFTFTTVGGKPVEKTLPVTIYPNTYVQRNGVLYEPVKTVDDFSDDSTEVTIKANSNGNGNDLAAWNRNANAAEITVNNLPTENGADQLTIDNIDSTTADKNNWLVELTLNYSNVDDVRAIITFTSNSDKNWWLLRNTFGGTPGGGTAFRAAANSSDENSKYTLTAGQDATLGYLFNGAKTNTAGGSTAYFFFNGETKTVLLNSSTNPIDKAPSLSDSFVLTFAKEGTGTDNGTITLKKIVFYKPVEDAAQ